MLPFGESQRVQVGLLVSPLAIGGDELHHPDLLALVFGGLRIVLHRRLGAHTHLADLGEVVADHRVGYVLYLNEVRFDPRQFVKIVAPLLGDAIWIAQVGLVKVLHIGGVPTCNM